MPTRPDIEPKTPERPPTVPPSFHTPVATVSANDPSFGGPKPETVALLNPTVKMDLDKAVVKIPRIIEVAFPFLAPKESQRTIRLLMAHLKKCKIYDGGQKKWEGRPGSDKLADIEVEMAAWLEKISEKCDEYLTRAKGKIFGMSKSYIS